MSSFLFFGAEYENVYKILTVLLLDPKVVQELKAMMLGNQVPARAAPIKPSAQPANLRV